MTTPLLTAVPAYVSRPVSWRHLGWVAWRRYRTALLGTAALLLLAALYLVVSGLGIRAGYAAVESCLPKGSADCRFAYQNFHNTYAQPGPFGAVLLFVPGIVGAFAGAPLLARELETGTFRYVWTQGVGRTRWLLGMLVPGALGVAAATAALGALVAWQQQPLIDSGIQQTLHASTFPLTGIAAAGWGLAAYSVGALAGLLIRRAIAAVAATLAVWTGFQFLAADFRPNYQTPIATSRLQLAASDLPITQWWTHHGTSSVRRSSARSCDPSECSPATVEATTRSAPAAAPPTHAIPAAARIRAVDELPAGQSLLDLPEHRVRLAAPRLTAPPRNDHLARAPAPRMIALSSRPDQLCRAERPPGAAGATPLEQ